MAHQSRRCESFCRPALLAHLALLCTAIGQNAYRCSPFGFAPQAGVQPLAGCLPTLATIPVFIGLYRSLTNVAGEGLLDAEGFYWIKSLAGPTSVAARQVPLKILLHVVVQTKYVLPAVPFSYRSESDFNPI